MLNIPKLTTKQLKDLTTYKELLRTINYQFSHPQALWALSLLLERKLAETNLAQTDPRVHEAYQYLILFLKFKSLYILKDEEVLSLIENHGLDALKICPDLDISLRSKLFIMPIIFRDDFLAKLREALQRNKQRLGIKPIQIIQYKESVEPFVAYWLLDYDNALGTGFHREAERELYLSGSPNVKTLTDKEKELLKELLWLYDLLKLTIREPGGLGSYSISTFVDVTKIDPKLIERLEEIY